MTSSPSTTPPPFRRVLVANRGEIAIRVFRTLRELGIESVAIYSDADRDSMHVRHADQAFAIGGELPTDSYLRQDVVLGVAKRAGVDAIHPGYGFLAENAEFARACGAAGITFVGPTPEAIDAMGSKTASRELMRAAGVPIVPGSTEPLESFEQAKGVAEEVGYPIAVKARSGGGGKGFRVALTPEELQSAYEGASREGERYFSDGAVYLERYLHDPRHVEVQLLADHHGTVIHLGERDCSVQRRHQKLIEEAPGPHVGNPEYAASLRAKLGEIAVGAARAVGYRNAGTIECLLGPDGEPFFLEMNTRVQVEHTVTEMVTGVDIVAEQLRIAAGQPLRFAQEDVTFTGHALECRINAEDARHDFRPSSGSITRWNEPSGIGVRVDSGFANGSVVTPFYDTLLAKLVVWAEDRDAAIARMRRALDEFEIAGVETLVDFHRAAMEPGGEFSDGGSLRGLVADPAPALDALPVPVGRALGAAPAAVDDPTELLMEIDGRRAVVKLHDPARALPEPPAVRARSGGISGAPGEVLAPIPGNVLQVLVQPGQAVQAGEVVCILEAMKMENEIAAPASGTVEAVRVEPGEAVAAGHVLVSVATEA
ncbi:MAG: acetyl-CoA carboxylase, biotin carboxylase [Thermoleophilia bacterium]|nr:acetyl-CoA carboxylase, biotin carboxylase [Thermoleophilia bacterium]